MPLYGVPEVGGQLAAIGPGDSFVLFDGTETPAVGLKSRAFARAQLAGQPDYGITFDGEGVPSGMTVDVQVANTNKDSAYGTPVNAQIQGDANGNGQYTDKGYSKFYRLEISAYTSGAMPVVKAQR